MYYVEGWHAYHKGILRDGNPYPDGEARAMWFAGWDAAKANQLERM